MSRQILDLHGVGTHQEVAADAVAASIWSFLHLLLPLVVVHAQLDQVHLLQDLEVHVDDLLTEERALQEAKELLLPDHSVKEFEYLSQLEWVSLSIILWKWKWVIRAA